MKYLYLILGIISFVVTLYLTPWAIRYMKRIGVVVKDQNKKKQPLIPISGGLAVFAGMFISIMFITIVGFIDDLLIKRNKESSVGLRQWQKPLLTLSAAIPLMVVNAGTRIVNLPFLGRADIGLLYPLLLVPLGVVIAANMVNMLAGFNGMESGMGIIYTLSLGLYSLFYGTQVAAIIRSEEHTSEL